MTVLTGFALVLCLGALLMVHHRMHTTVTPTTSDRMISDAQRLVSILEYHYAQCLRDVTALADSLPEGVTLRGTESGQSSLHLISTKLEALHKRFHRLLTENYGNHIPPFHRILIINANGDAIFDSVASDAPQTSITGNTILYLATQANVHTVDQQIMLTAAIAPRDPSAGFVAAWLNGETIFRQMTAYPIAPGHLYGMMDASGRIIFPERLPDAIRSGVSDQLKNLSDGTMTTIDTNTNSGQDTLTQYMAIAFPVPQTPLKLLSILPTAQATGNHHSWHYGIIVAALSLTLLFLYFMQQRINHRNQKLLTRYTKAQRQYRIMVQNNEDLANEILLRKRAESELKILNEHLEEIVTHRTRKLRRALDDLQTTQSQLIQSGKLASIGELAAGIAHELNQPLMVIRGNAQLMARMLKKSKMDPDQLPSFFDTIERNTKRMILIINHLRSFSRQSSKDFQSVDVNQVINDAFLMIGEQMRLRNIETIKNLSTDLPYIKGDPYQLEQVFLNLLTNARDAIEAYQPEQNGHRQKKEIVITTRLKNGGSNTVEILFKDTGCGIAPKDMDNIFDPFFTTKEVGKGTGLGLSISYGILQQHGGHLEFVDTTPGKTTLIVVLPAQ